MAKYRNDLPHSSGEVLLTDGGLETTLIFDNEIDLPLFASYPLLDHEAGRSALKQYYRHYVNVAINHGVSIVLDTPTWRASADWGAKLGHDTEALNRLNTKAVELLQEVRSESESESTKIVISGNLGPRGDGYDPGDMMSSAAAKSYHQAQINTFAEAGADLITVLTMTYVDEAIGIAQAAQESHMPIVVAFTVETDGKLPSGQSLRDAIEQVDAATDSSVLCFGINCAHPEHFDDVLNPSEEWVKRVGLLRANASRMSHDELDNSEELDSGNPEELGRQFADLRKRVPSLLVLGGCCGTDHRHIREIAAACL